MSRYTVERGEAHGMARSNHIPLVAFLLFAASLAMTPVRSAVPESARFHGTSPTGAAAV